MLPLHGVELVQWILVFPMGGAGGGGGQEKMAVWTELSYCFICLFIYFLIHYCFKSGLGQPEHVNGKRLQSLEELGSAHIFSLLLHVFFF